jgi:hypothetical protein
MNKTTPVALAALSALALVGGAAITGSTAQADDGASRLPAPPAKKALVQSCSGSGSTGMVTRTMDYQGITAGSTVEVEGSSWQVKGPKKGTDTVLVTMSTLAYVNNESLMAQLYKNGVGTSEGTKYVAVGVAYDQATVTFCTKIKKGNHTLALRVQDSGGSASALYYPTVTYQRFS